MKTIRLYCKTCNAKLTDDLTEMSSTALRFEDGVDMIVKNKFSITNLENRDKEIVIAIDAYYFKNHNSKCELTACTPKKFTSLRFLYDHVLNYRTEG